MKPISMAIETTFKGKRSYFQKPMKLLSKANEASFNLKRSQFQSQTKPVSISNEAFLFYYISKLVRDAPKNVMDA